MNKIQGFGLQPKIEDKRDLSLGSIFGVAKLKHVPDTDFIVSWPKFMKNQLDTDFCAAAATTAASEDQEDIELSFEFQFAAMCKLRDTYEEWGCDLRTAMKSFTKIGSIPKEKAPFSVLTHDRDFLADWRNWPEDLFRIAKFHAKETFFDVDGPYDMFDNIRSALWKHRLEERTIVTGAKWRASWTADSDGIIRPSTEEEQSFGHAFKIFGQKVVEGELMLLAQLSNGEVGDKGIYYFGREVVNREFSVFGAYMFKDIPRSTAEYYQKNKISLNDSLLVQVFKLILNKITSKI